jgi:hypothetical protein
VIATVVAPLALIAIIAIAAPNLQFPTEVTAILPVLAIWAARWVVYGATVTLWLPAYLLVGRKLGRLGVALLGAVTWFIAFAGIYAWLVEGNEWLPDAMLTVPALVKGALAFGAFFGLCGATTALLHVSIADLIANALLAPTRRLLKTAAILVVVTAIGIAAGGYTLRYLTGFAVVKIIALAVDGDLTFREYVETSITGPIEPYPELPPCGARTSPRRYYGWSGDEPVSEVARTIRSIVASVLSRRPTDIRAATTWEDMNTEYRASKVQEAIQHRFGFEFPDEQRCIWTVGDMSSYVEHRGYFDLAPPLTESVPSE